MEDVLISDYCSMKFDLGNALIEHIWLSASESMSTADFKDICLQWRGFCVERKVKFNLLDTSDFQFSVAPEVQAWLVSDVITPVVEVSMQKMATILPKDDLFAQVSVEQSMEENESQGGLPSKYFDNIDDARAWLLS